MSDKGAIRILIIDDDIEFANLLRMHLSAAGYAAEVAEVAVEGCKALPARPPLFCATSTVGRRINAIR